MRIGVNGHNTLEEVRQALLRGEPVAAGSFSGDTGYSGWWTEYHPLKEDKGLVKVIHRTDTSHGCCPGCGSSQCEDPGCMIEIVPIKDVLEKLEKTYRGW